MSKLSAEQREEFTTTEQRLTFVRRSHTKKYRDKRGYYSTTIWNVYLCICGNEKIAQQNHVRRGEIRSCGCLKSEVSKKIGKATHKMNLVPIKPGETRVAKLGGRKKGSVPPNKGKVKIPDNPHERWSTGYYITPEELEARYHGIEGEVHSLRQRSQAHNKGKRFVDGKYK